MKPIIFARVTDMKYYRGITNTDKPCNGGSYVKDTGYAHECNNFKPVECEDIEKCIGFSMMSSGKDVKQLHIENIYNNICSVPDKKFIMNYRQIIEQYLILNYKEEVRKICKSLNITENSYNEMQSCMTKKGTDKPSKKYYGCHSTPSHNILINCVLNSKDVPKEVVKFVIYHEMLHLNNMSHDAFFYELEHKYPNYEEWDHFLDAHMKRFDIKEW